MGTDLIYAIGDIHGCYDKMVAAISRIRVHSQPSEHRVIFLGDYIDRGPDSRRVVELLLELVTAGGTDRRWFALRGNHEEMMVQAVNGGDALDQWMLNGGEQTRMSYEGYESQLLEHVQWLAKLPVMIQTDNHCFVHAGCSPRYALDDQPSEVLLWIRGWELDSHDFGKHIVYGHTPYREPLLLSRSSGLDTGACYGGPLTIGVFESHRNAGPVEIIQVV